MGVVTTKATAISNRDATPKILSNANISKGTLMQLVGTIETTGTDSATSKYIMGSIPSNARVSRVLLSCDGNNTSGAMDIGLYRTTLGGSTVVDADLFASAQALGTALINSDVTHESAEFGIEDVEKPLWAALGLSEDPKYHYDVVCTITTADDSADTISLKVEYVI